jgi:molybdopterin-binding protein
MEISARNQIRGRVKSIVKGAVMAEVEVEIVIAAITAGSVERLGLRENDEVVVIVKATDVMIGK